MPDGPDMAAPVTRRELHEALELWAGAIMARVDAKFAEKFAEIKAFILNREEVMIDRMEALFDPHRGVPQRVKALEEAELPARVTKLEARVFAPKRRASKTSRRRKR